MFLVGLTGGIASGKSTVAERLCYHGAELIDADEVAREVVLPGTPAFRRIVAHFGAKVLDAEGFIDRPALGRIVFADPSQRAVLNELTHPPVMAEIANRLEALAPFDGVVVIDVPLLVEAGVDRGYDAILVVATKPEQQVRRLVQLRSMTEDEARARIAAQAPLEAKLAVATHVIWNEGSIAELLERTDELSVELTRCAERKVAKGQAGAPAD